MQSGEQGTRNAEHHSCLNLTDPGGPKPRTGTQGQHTTGEYPITKGQHAAGGYPITQGQHAAGGYPITQGQHATGGYPITATSPPSPLCSGLRGSLDGRGVWRKRGACVCMAEFLCCLPETITMLLISYTPIQNKKLNSNLRETTT